MKKLILILFLVLCSRMFVHAQAYGLAFASHESVQEKRTALNLTPNEPFRLRQVSDLSFDLQFATFREIYFGYVVRIIFNNNENVDLVYNEITKQFNFLVGEHLAAAFGIDSMLLYRQWNHLRIQLSPQDHSAAIFYNDKKMGAAQGKLDANSSCRIFFGTNNFEGYQTVDIPPMSLRDVTWKEDGRPRNCWPLNESTGTQARDSIQDKTATVANPGWMRPKHQNWELAASLQVPGRASVAFDRNKEMLYIVSADSVLQFSFHNMQLRNKPYTEHQDTLIAGNQSVFDPFRNKLYNFYIDEKKVSTYDTAARKWDQHFNARGLTLYWQVNKFVGADSALYVLGGYGYLRYKNGVQRYSLTDHTWDSLPVKGDRFTPRYLAALGANTAGDTAYILGGYGSSTGDQVVNPRHYYDLLSFSIKDRSFKTIYHLKEPEEQFCFANSLVVIPGTRSYYALIYPNDKFNTNLQLISGSLDKPEYTLLANAIPYSFYDIQSFSDLYYCPDSKKLVAVTLYNDKATNLSAIKVYTIAFPPNQLPVVTPAARLPKTWWAWLALPLAAAVYWLLRRRGRKVRLVKGLQPASLPEKPAQPQRAAVQAPVAPDHNTAPVTPGHNTAPAESGTAGSQQVTAAAANGQTAPITAPVAANIPTAPAAPVATNNVVPSPLATPAIPHSHIYFFGQFEVADKEGQDLTRLFTPLLKELFLIISIHTLRSGKGIAAEKLYATLWRDKSAKEAQNNRSVNMVKLKAILDKLGPCNFVKEAERWSLHYDKDQICMDLATFLRVVQEPRPLQPEQVTTLLHILRRGPLLADTELEWLEDIQSAVADMAISTLTDAIAQFPHDPELLIETANCIFLFDPVNEEALRVKCRSLGVLGRHSMAKAAFDKFAREYHHMYGEDFQHTFHEVFS